MFYTDPFTLLDKQMKERWRFHRKITKESISYYDYLRWYHEALDKELEDNHESMMQDEIFRFEKAICEVTARADALEEGEKSPRYFLTDEGLIKFLTEMPVKSLKYLQDNWSGKTYFIYTPKESYFCECKEYEDGTKALIVAKDKDYCLLFPIDNLDNPNRVILDINEDARKSKKQFIHLREQINRNADYLKTNFQFCINTLFYTIAFPEAVKEGCPRNIAVAQKNEFKQNKAKVLTLSVDARVLTKERNGVTPHFRSGYFRHYTSDRYVNCKGEIRFIEATFVKGKPFMIEDIIKQTGE